MLRKNLQRSLSSPENLPNFNNRHPQAHRVPARRKLPPGSGGGGRWSRSHRDQKSPGRHASPRGYCHRPGDPASPPLGGRDLQPRASPLGSFLSALTLRGRALRGADFASDAGVARCQDGRRPAHALFRSPRTAQGAGPREAARTPGLPTAGGETEFSSRADQVGRWVRGGLFSSPARCSYTS